MTRRRALVATARPGRARPATRSGWRPDSAGAGAQDRPRGRPPATGPLCRGVGSCGARGARMVRREVSGRSAGRSVDTPKRWLSGSPPARFSIDSSAPRRDGVRTSADLPRWDVDDEPNLTRSIQPTTAGWFRQSAWLPDLARSNDVRSATPAHAAGTRGDPPPQHGPSHPAAPRDEIPVLTVDLTHPATRDHGTAEKTQALGHLSDDPTCPAPRRIGVLPSSAAPGSSAHRRSPSRTARSRRRCNTPARIEGMTDEPA